MADKDFVVKNGLVVNTNLIVANGDSNRVGINNSTPDASLTVTGTANISGNVVLGGETLNVASNTTFTGNVQIRNTAVVDTRLYVGNTTTMVPGLPSIIQAVDNFNGFVMISSQNLSTLDDACADLLIYADNTNGLSHFNDLGINNSRFDGTLHRISANTLADNLILGETVFQSNGTVNVAVGIVRDVTVINSTSRSVKISVLETDGIESNLGAPNFSNTTGANLSLRGVTSGVNTSILVAVPFGVSSAFSRRNYPFTIGKRGDGYLYNANSALTIGTTRGGLRVDLQSVSLSFSSGANQVTLSSGNTDTIYADLIIEGTNIPSNTYITSITNSTSFKISKPTTGSASGSYTLTDPFYDAAGNPIIFHINGMTANDEVGRISGNGNFTIGRNNFSRDSKLTVGGTANITGNTAFGNNVTVAGNIAVSGTANAIAFRAGPNVTLDTSKLTIGNSTVNSTQNSVLMQITNASSTANLTAGDLTIGAVTTVNSSQITATLFSGNLAGAYANITGQVNTGTLFVSGSSNLASATIANSVGVWTTGTVNAASHTTGSGLGDAGATVNATTIGVSTNSTVNTVVNSSLLRIANATTSSNLTAADLKIGSTTTVNSTQITATLFSGNLAGSYANITGQVNTGTLFVSGSSNLASATIANSTGIWTTGSVNAVTHTAGALYGGASAGMSVNSTVLGISSNTTVNASVSPSLIQIANSSGSANITPIDIKVGVTTINGVSGTIGSGFVTNSTGTFMALANSSTVNTTTANVSTALNVGANVTANTTAFRVGNTTVNSFVVSDTVQVANSTATSNLSPTALRIGANVAVGTAQINVGANVYANHTSIYTGNTTEYSSQDLVGVRVVNSTATSNLTATALRMGANVTVNTSQISVGANVYANHTTVYTGNATVNAFVNSELIQIANSTTTSNLTPVALRMGANVTVNTTTVFTGNSTVNTVANSELIQIANSTTTSNLTPIALRMGANVTVNTTQVFTGNATVNAFVNSALIQIANSTATSNLAPNALRVGANTTVNATTLFTGNSTVNTIANSEYIQIANATATSNLTPVALRMGANVTVNTSQVSVGANVYANHTTVFTGNATVNAFVNSALIQIANSSITSNLTPEALRVGANTVVNTTTMFAGNATVNAFVNSALIQIANSTATSNLVPNSLRVGANTTVNATTVFTGNSTVNTFANSELIQIANSSITSNLTPVALRVGANVTVNTSQVSVGANVYANHTTVYTGNATVNAFVNSELIQIANSTVTSNLTPVALRVGANVTVNTTTVFTGNSTVNTFANSELIQIANSTVTSNLTPVALRVGANTVVNTTTVFTGNSTVNTIANSEYIQIANSTATSNLTPNALRVGANTTVNATTVFTGNNTVNSFHTSDLIQIANSTSTSNLTPVALRVGANVTVNTTIVFTGNATVNAFVNSELIQIANSSITSNLTPVALRVGANATVNTTTVFTGNSTVNSYHTSSLIQIANSTATSNLTPEALRVGANVTVNTTQVTVGSDAIVNTSAARIGSTTTGANSTVVTATAISFGNSTVNATINSTAYTGAANSASYIGSLPAANVVSNAQLAGNLANYQLTSGLTTSVAGLTANDSTHLNGQTASYYRNADNINAGTLASTRISGNYTGITNVGTLGTLSVTGNAALNNFSVSSNSTVNTVAIVASNVNIDSGTLFVDSINNRVGVNTTTPDAALQVVGNANISGNIAVGGNFTVSGNITYVGTSVSQGDFIPSADGLNLGNTSQRWSLVGTVANLSIGMNAPYVNSTSYLQVGNSTVFTFANSSRIDLPGTITIGNSTVNTVANSSTLTVGNSTVNALLNSTSLTVGNSTVNAIVNSSSISIGNSTVYTFANSSRIEASGNVIIGGNATITSGTLTLGNSTSNVAVTLGNSTTSSVLYIGNSTVNSTLNSTAFSGSANNATNLNGQAASYYRNADNINAGTLNNARLNAANTSQSGIVQLSDSVTSTSIVLAGTANSVKNAYDRAIDANTRAASAQSAAVDAYSNAVTNLAPKASPSFSGTVTAVDVTLTGTLSVGNSTVNSVVNSVSLTLGNSTVNSTSTSTVFQVANSTGNTQQSATAVLAQSNSTVNASMTASLMQVANSTGNVQHTATFVLAQTNTTVNATMTASLMQVANSTGNTQQSATAVLAQTNTTVNATMTASLMQVANASGNTQQSATFVLAQTNTTVNATMTASLMQVANASGNTQQSATTVAAQTNSTVNATMTASMMQVANASGNAQIVPTTISVQNSTVNSVLGLQSLSIQTNTTVNSSITNSLVQVANASGNVQATATSVKLQTNSTVNSTLTSSSLVIGNTTIQTTNAIFGGTIAVNSSVGSAGQVLRSGGGANAYWGSAAEINTTYDLLTIANTTTNQGIVRLKDNNNSNDDIQFTGTGGITLSSNATHVIIGGSGVGLTYDLLSVANTEANAGRLRLKDNNNSNDDVIVSGANGVFVTSNSTHLLITGQINTDTDTNTTYDLLAIANTEANAGRFRLKDSNNSNDDIIVTGANGVFVSSNSTHLLITGQIDTDTNTLYDLLAVANTEANAGRLRLRSSGDANDDVIVTGANGVFVTSNSTHLLITGQTGDITAVTAGNGLTGGGTSGDVTIDVVGGNGITVAADSVAVTEGVGLAVNSTGVHVKANSGIVANSTGTFVNTAYIATLDANNAAHLGGVAAASYVQNTDSRTLSGNLVLSGANTTVNAVFRVVNSSANVFFVSSTGNIGIGNVSPTGRLHIFDATENLFTLAGDSTTIQRVQRYSSDATGGAINFHKGRGSHSGIAAVANGDTIGTMSYVAYDGSFTRTVAYIDGAVETRNATNDISGTVRIFTRPTGASASATERLRITGSGNVGISNTAPDATLAVTGTANVSSDVRIGGITTLVSNVVLGTTTITANGGVGTAGHVLTSGGSGNVYWAAPQVGDITAVTAGDGLTGGGTSGDVTLNVIGGNGITVAADSVAVTEGVGLSVNSTGVHVKANTGIVANATGTYVNASYIATLDANNASFLNGYTWAAPAILGSTTANGASLTYANVSGQVNTATIYITTSANIASIVQANSLGVHVGANVTANTTTLRVGNTTLTTTNTILGGTLAANGGVGTAGQVLTSGGAGNTYWADSAGAGGGYYKGNLGAVGSTTNKGNLYRINSNTQTTSVTIDAGENAMVAGPLVIQSGSNLTVSVGGRVVIV